MTNALTTTATTLYDVVATHSGQIMNARVEIEDGAQWVHATVEFDRGVDSTMFGYVLRLAWPQVDRIRAVEHHVGEDTPVYVWYLAFERGRATLI